MGKPFKLDNAPPQSLGLVDKIRCGVFSYELWSKRGPQIPNQTI